MAAQPRGNFEIRIDSGVAWLEVHGRSDPAVASSSIAQLDAALVEHGIWRVVVDMRAAKLALNEMELFGSVEEAEATQVLKRAAVALLVPAITPRYKFLEDSARRAGQGLHLFTDGESALRWLAQQPAADLPAPAARSA